MKRTFVALLTIAAGLTATAATASAYTAQPGHTIKYVTCSNTTVDIDLQNSYGNHEGRSNIRFTQPVKNSTWKCGTYTYVSKDSYGQYASVSVTADDGGAVFCSILDNGRKVSGSQDSNRYFAYASCD